MQNNMALTVVAVALGGGILSTVLYYVVRCMRGSLKMSLPRTTFNPGDAIEGRFDLQAKQAIQGNKLIASLIGVQTSEYHEHGRTQRRSQEIYRDEVTLEDARLYPAGYTRSYDFRIVVPAAPGSGFVNSSLGKTLAVVLDVIGNRRMQLRWTVEARLDAKGVDLATAKTISINGYK